MSSLNHNLNSLYTFYSFINVPISGYLPEYYSLPNEIEFIDEDNINVDNGTLSGKNIFSLPDKIMFQETNSARWDLKHDLNSECLMMETLSSNTYTTINPQANVLQNTLQEITIPLNIPFNQDYYFCSFSEDTNISNIFYGISLNQILKNGIYVNINDTPTNSFNILWNAEIPSEQFGRISITGLQEVEILFTSPFSDTNYQIQGTFENSQDGLFYCYYISEKRVDGIKIKFSDIISENDSYFNWIAFNEYEENSQGGILSLTSGTSSATIPISGIVDTNYGLTTILSNLTDGSSANFYLTNISDRSSEKFTVNFSDDLSTGNYEIYWYLRKTTQILNNSKVILPKEIEIIDKNNVYVYWNKPMSGSVIFKKFGNILSEEQKYPLPFGDGNILSPHYKVEIDLSSSPISTEYNEIIGKNIETSLYSEWEKFRPSSRVAHYVAKLEIDGLEFGKTKTINQYDSILTPNIKHSCVFNRNNAIYNTKVLANLGTAKKTWVLEHDFNSTSLFCQCYDENFQILDSKIEYTSKNKITVFHGKEKKGYVFIKKADYDIPYNFYYNSNVINNPGNYTSYLVQFSNKFTDLEMIPYEVNFNINSINVNFIDLEENYSLLFGKMLLLKPDLSLTQESSADVWYINHNSGYKYHFVSCKDENGNIIKPNSINFIDENNLSIVFRRYIKGSVDLCYITDPKMSEDVFFSKIRDGKIEIRLSNTNQENLTVLSNKDMINKIATYNNAKIKSDDNYYYVIFEIPFQKDLEIKSWGIFDSEDVGNMIYFISNGNILYKIRGFNLEIIYKFPKLQEES